MLYLDNDRSQKDSKPELSTARVVEDETEAHSRQKASLGFTTLPAATTRRRRLLRCAVSEKTDGGQMKGVLRKKPETISSLHFSSLGSLKVQL